MQVELTIDVQIASHRAGALEHKLMRTQGQGHELQAVH